MSSCSASWRYPPSSAAPTTPRPTPRGPDSGSSPAQAPDRRSRETSDATARGMGSHRTRVHERVASHPRTRIPTTGVTPGHLPTRRAPSRRRPPLRQPRPPTKTRDSPRASGGRRDDAEAPRDSWRLSPRSRLGRLDARVEVAAPVARVLPASPSRRQGALTRRALTGYSGPSPPRGTPNMGRAPVPAPATAGAPPPIPWFDSQIVLEVHRPLPLPRKGPHPGRT